MRHRAAGCRTSTEGVVVDFFFLDFASKDVFKDRLCSVFVFVVSMAACGVANKAGVLVKDFRGRQTVTQRSKQNKYRKSMYNTPLSCDIVYVQLPSESKPALLARLVLAVAGALRRECRL